MNIVIVTPKGQYRLASISVSFVTFLFCCIMAFAGAALVLGILFQVLAQISPFLISTGIAMLKLSAATFLSYRTALWLWRLIIRRAWISTFAYRRELLLSLRKQLHLLLKLLALMLFS